MMGLEEDESEDDEDDDDDDEFDISLFIVWFYARSFFLFIYLFNLNENRFISIFERNRIYRYNAREGKNNLQINRQNFTVLLLDGRNLKTG